MEYPDLQNFLQRKVTQTPNSIALPQPVLDDFVAACDRSHESSEAAFGRGARWLAPGGPKTATLIPVAEVAGAGPLDVVIHPVGDGRYAVTVPVTLVAVLYNLFGLMGPFPGSAPADFKPFTIGDLYEGKHAWIRCREAWNSHLSQTPLERRQTILGKLAGRHLDQTERLAALEPLAARIDAEPAEVCQWTRDPLMFITGHEIGHAISRHWSFDLSAEDEAPAAMSPLDFERCCELEADAGAVDTLIVENVLPHSGTRIRRLADAVAVQLFGREISELTEAETDRFMDALSPPLFYYMHLSKERFHATGSLDDEAAVATGEFRALMGAVIGMSLQSISESCELEPPRSVLLPEYRYQLAAHMIVPGRPSRATFVAEFAKWCDAAAERHNLPDLRTLCGLSFSSEAHLGTREHDRLQAVFRMFSVRRPSHQPSPQKTS